MNSRNEKVLLKLFTVKVDSVLFLSTDLTKVTSLAEGRYIFLVSRSGGINHLKIYQTNKPNLRRNLSVCIGETWANGHFTLCTGDVKAQHLVVLVYRRNVSCGDSR